MSVLPDVLKPGLRVVFCGTAVGSKSARAGAYYAGRGNQFWSVLYRVGLTPRQLEPQEFRLLLQYGIGLTDLAKRRSGSDGVLSSSNTSHPNTSEPLPTSKVAQRRRSFPAAWSGGHSPHGDRRRHLLLACR